MDEKKLTITDLAKYLGNSRNKFYEMKKNKPQQFELIWAGWIVLVQSEKQAH